MESVEFVDLDALVGDIIKECVDLSWEEKSDKKNYEFDIAFKLNELGAQYVSAASSRVLRAEKFVTEDAVIKWKSQLFTMIGAKYLGRDISELIENAKEMMFMIAKRDKEILDNKISGKELALLKVNDDFQQAIDEVKIELKKAFIKD